MSLVFLFLTLLVSTSKSCSPFSNAFAGLTAHVDVLSGSKGSLVLLLNQLTCENMRDIEEGMGPMHTRQLIDLHGSMVAARKKRGMTIHLIDWEEPAFWHGKVFEAFIWPTVAVHLLYDSDGDHQVWDETGDWDGEAALSIIQNALGIAIAIAEALEACPVPAVAKSVAEVIKAVTDTLVDMIGEEDGQIHNRILQRIVSVTSQLHAAARCKNATGWPAKPTIGQGCNGQNDNCDQYLIIDECDEDLIAPVFTMSPTSLPQWFSTQASAEAAVTQMVQPSDDCQGVTTTVHLTTNASYGCENSMVQVTSTDDCGNQASVNIPVKLDIQPPVITCNVSLPGTTSWSNILMTVDNGLYNVNFTYNVTDNCGAGDVTTTIALMADEQVESTSTPQGYILRTWDGIYKGVILRASNGYNSNGRWYTIIATATNKAGLSSTCTQTVGVRYYTAYPWTGKNDGPYFLVTNCNNGAI